MKIPKLQRLPGIEWNIPQLQAILFNARLTINMWGRATGKTVFFAWILQKAMHEMPGSTWFVVGRTYGQLQTNVMPRITATWERLGYREGVHYWVGTYPKNVSIPKPLAKPLNNKYFIFWYTGACTQMISQDREGAGRGPSYDGGVADEGLTLIEDRFKEELLPALRGNEDIGWDTDLHHAIVIASSKPTGTEGNWLLDYGKYYLENGLDIDLVNGMVADLIIDWLESEDPEERRNLMAEIKGLESQVKYYPNNPGTDDEVYYSEATAFDNLANVGGLKYIRREYLNLSILKFRVEILNQTLKAVPNGFYFSLDEKIHYRYEGAFDDSYLESLGWDRERLTAEDSRRDGGLIRGQGFHIACDYGFYLNCLVACQEHRSDTVWEDRWQNAFWRKPPFMISQVVQDFCDYYMHHPTKEVVYYYDQTAVDKAGKPLSYYEQVIQTLERNGWVVTPVYLGQVPSPDNRYNLWGRALQNDFRLPSQVFYMPRTRYLTLSMKLTGVVQGKHGFTKDKRLERKGEQAPQEEAPHLSDAADILMYGKNMERLEGESVFVDNVMGVG